MKNLAFIFILVLISLSTKAQTDSTKKEKIFPVYMEASAGLFFLLEGPISFTSDLGLGYRFNKQIGLGVFYAKFETTTNSEGGVAGARGYGLKLRYTPGKFLLLEGGLGLISTSKYSDGDTFNDFKWDKNKSQKLFYSFIVAYRFARIMYLGINFSTTSSQFFEIYDYRTNIYLGRNATHRLSGFTAFTLGISIPPHPIQHKKRKAM